MATRTRGSGQLQSRTLWPMRGLWLLTLALILTMLVVNAPANVIYARHEYTVEQARPAILALTSLQQFAEVLVAARWLSVSVYVAVALLIAWRKWSDPFALLVSAALLPLAWAFVMRGDGSTWQYPTLLAPIGPALTLFMALSLVLTLVLLFFLFPDGRFLSRRHRWLAGTVIAATGLFFVADTLRPLSGSFRQLVERWASPLWSALLIGALIAGLAGQVRRYRRLATPAEQRQIKWVLFGLAGVLAVPLLSWPLEDMGGAWGTLVAIAVDLVAMTFLPLTIGFSMLRYRLWEVDLVINRTLVYGTLTAIVLSVYGLSVGAAATALRAQVAGVHAVLALGVALLLVAPLTARVRRLADRWVPVPDTPPAAADERPDGDGPQTPWLRLAQATWVGLLALLAWQVATQLADIGAMRAALRNEWIVRTALGGRSFVAPDLFGGYLLLLRLALLAIHWGMALLLFQRRRDDRMALFVAFCLLLIPVGLGLAGDDVWRESLGPPLIGLALLISFLFPDGRFVPQSRRWRVALMLALPASFGLGYLLAGLLLPGYGAGEHEYLGLLMATAVAMGAGLASQLYRYRRLATPAQRQQTKWVILGLGLPLLWIGWALLWTLGALGPLGLSRQVAALVAIHLTVGAFAALPLTLGLSILRYRLWEIDLLLNRSLVYGTLTVLVTAVYALVVGLSGSFLQSADSLVLTVLATGLVAVLFNPLRHRLQAGVNRLMYGERDDPGTVLTRLGKRLEETAVPGETLPTLVRTIAHTLKLPYVAIAVSGEVIAAEGARPRAPLRHFPLVYQSRPIGRLLVASRAAAERFTPQEERLLRDVARQAGPAVHAEQLTLQLERSRERLVTTREEERRRLRRDLHDGLGPRLATLAVKVSAAQNLLQQEPEVAGRLLGDVKAESQNVLAEIRRVVDGLRPSTLDQLGLVSALRQFAEQGGIGHPQITVTAPERLPWLPAAVEVAAYHIATEALTNAVRHARARHCAVRLEVNGDLYLEIRDDGQGLPDDYEPGVGLESMRERAQELRGRFDINSKPGRGTVVTVRLPLTSAP